MPSTLHRCVRPRSASERLHRRQPRDQADDLRGADVENRQDRALARGNLPHSRRERRGSSWLRRLLRRVSRRPTRQRTPRESRTNTRPGARKSSARTSRSRSRDWRWRRSRVAIAACGSIFRKLDLDAGLQLEVPAALADQHARLDARPEFVHGVREAPQTPARACWRPRRRRTAGRRTGRHARRRSAPPSAAMACTSPSFCQTP